MNSDVLFAGLFGVLATLAGVIATHALSFSRDRRIREGEQRGLYGAMATELRNVQEGFRTAITHVPRFQSASVFVIRGGSIDAPVDVALRLAKMAFILERIGDITREHSAFCVAVVGAGNPNLEWSDRDAVAERKTLVERAMDEIPPLVSTLEALARGARR
jgi:hypothetical protein